MCAKSHDERGQALLEMALVLPVLVLLLLGIIDLGRILFHEQAVTAAARDAARYASVGATDTQIGQALQADMSPIGTATWSVQPDPRVSGNPVTISVTNAVYIMDPVMSAFLGPVYQVHATVTMRVE